MKFYDDNMDDNFVDYQMILYKIRENEFSFKLELNDRIEYGNSKSVIDFISNECLFYLRHIYSKYIGERIIIKINRYYNGKIHNFTRFEALL